MMGNYAGLYFAGYALCGTIALVTMYPAMVAVHKREGKPINKNLLRFVGGMTAAAWLGAGVFSFA